MVRSHMLEFLLTIIGENYQKSGLHFLPHSYSTILVDIVCNMSLRKKPVLFHMETELVGDRCYCCCIFLNSITSYLLGDRFWACHFCVHYHTTSPPKTDSTVSILTVLGRTLELLFYVFSYFQLIRMN